MTNEITFQQINDVVDKGVDSIVKKEGYAYTCGYFQGAIKSIAIIFPESRQEIIRIFSEINKEINK
jgi:hypothetical protein